MNSLPLFHRIANRHVLVWGEGEAAEAKARLIERAGGMVLRDVTMVIELNVRLAFVACEDDREAADIAEVLRAMGLLVNVVDRGELCDFTVPSLVDRDPVLLAVGTGGASAGLAKALRMRLEGLLPTGLGRLASGLSEARAAMRQRWPDAAARRQAIDAALANGGPLDLMAAGSEAALPGWLESQADAVATSSVNSIILRSDDPDDLTLREARWLASADWVVHDADAPAAVLARARADAGRRLATADAGVEAGAEALTGRVVRVIRADTKFKS